MTCTYIGIACKNKRHPNKLPEELRTGEQIGECTVQIAIPSPCKPRLSTKIEYLEWREYKTETLQENVCIYEIRGDGRVGKLYIYPKNVWDTVYKLYIEPLRQGKPVEEHLLLIGAPGTGKTVMAQLIARLLGVNTDILRPEEIKSKYYGETEKNLRRRLEEAVKKEPVVMIIDDADWILTARVVAKEEAEVTELGIRTIMFSWLEKVIREERRVLVVATTNISPSSIDEAYIRGGRFGEPIFIPLPSYEALYTYAKHMIKDENKARELALKALSRGLTISDLENMIRRLEKGLDPDFKRLGGRGYSRLHAEPIQEITENRQLRELIERYINISKDIPATIWFDQPFDIALPILAQILMNLKLPALVILDERYPDEFTYTLDAIKAVGVVATYMPPEIQRYIRRNTRQPLIYAGTRPPDLEIYTRLIDIEKIAETVGVANLVKAVSSYYKIVLGEDKLKQVERIYRTKSTTIVDILATIPATGTLTESALSRISVKQ